MKSVRKRRYMMLLAGACVALGGFLALRPPPAARLAPLERASNDAEETERAIEPRAHAVPAAPAAARRINAVIDEVKVEDATVCAGEEDLVRVRAHDASGDDADLQIFIDDHPGDTLIVRPVVDTHGTARPMYARAVAKDGSEAKAVIPITVKRCEAKSHVAVGYHVLPNTWGQLELTATVLDAFTLGKPATRIPASQVRGFHWEFGDGTTADTTGPVTEHDYEGRAEEKPSAELLVKVEATLANGRTVEGRTAMTIPNPAYRALKDKGTVLLLTAESPRFPVAEPDGSVRETVHLWHAHNTPVRISGVARYATKPDGKREQPIALRPVDVLGDTVVAAGKGLTLDVVLPPGDEPLVTYEIVGRTQDGVPAKGRFSVMRPPPNPTRENATKINDPGMVARIETARRELGKEFVTDEDLRRLHEEGRL
jgi:hypothetical protein